MANVSKTSKFQNTESKKSQPPVTFRIFGVSCVFRDIFFGGKNKWSLVQFLWKKSLGGTKILKNEGLWGPWGHFGMPLGLQGAKRDVFESFWAPFWWGSFRNVRFWHQKWSPWAPQASQNGAKMVPKSIQNSFQLPLGFLSCFWTILGSILASFLRQKSRIFEKSMKNMKMCENAPRPHEKHEFEGPRVPKWRPRPFWNELFFYLIFGSVFVLFWEPFWSILEAKIIQKCGLQITCGKMDFHVTLWTPWGVTIFKEPTLLGGCIPQDSPQLARFPIDNSLLSMGFCDKWSHRL